MNRLQQTFLCWSLHLCCPLIQHPYKQYQSVSFGRAVQDEGRSHVWALMWLSYHRWLTVAWPRIPCLRKFSYSGSMVGLLVVALALRFAFSVIWLYRYTYYKHVIHVYFLQQSLPSTTLQHHIWIAETHASLNVCAFAKSTAGTWVLKPHEAFLNVFAQLLDRKGDAQMHYQIEHSFLSSFKIQYQYQPVFMHFSPFCSPH